MAERQASLAVVVPTRDRPDLLRGCLDALLASGVPAIDLVVVDSASEDAAAVASAVERGISVIRCDEPGASRARNVGWRATSADLVAFVDDDVRVLPGWGAAIAEPFGDPEVVLVTGAVGADAPVSDRAVASTDDVTPGCFRSAATGNVGASANMAARRAALEAVGGFDELLGAGGRFRAAEDLDLFDRLLRMGTGWHAVDASAVHDQWRGRKELLRLEVAYGLGFGARIAKRLRDDRSQARSLAGYELRRLWDDLRGDVIRRYRFGVLSRLAWLAGTAVGLATAVTLPVHQGHLRRR